MRGLLMWTPGHQYLLGKLETRTRVGPVTRLPQWHLSLRDPSLPSTFVLRQVKGFDPGLVCPPARVRRGSVSSGRWTY
jgi:hypothetical protein